MTVSTMCSSSLGPASAPSFVTWPTKTTVVVPRLQASTISVATAPDLTHVAGQALPRFPT